MYSPTFCPTQMRYIRFRSAVRLWIKSLLVFFLGLLVYLMEIMGNAGFSRNRSNNRLKHTDVLCHSGKKKVLAFDLQWSKPIFLNSVFFLRFFKNLTFNRKKIIVMWNLIFTLSFEGGWNHCLVETKTSLKDHLVFLMLQLVTYSSEMGDWLFISSILLQVLKLLWGQ